MCGRGVAPGEQDVEQLGAQLDGVSSLSHQSVKEDVLLSVLLPVLGLGQSEPDKVVDKVVDNLARVTELLGVVKPVEVREADAVGEASLGSIKGRRQPGVHAAHLAALVAGEELELTVDGLAKEELSGYVEGEAEEVGLEINLVDPAVGCDHGLQQPHQVLNVCFLEFEVADLVSGELGTEQGLLAPSHSRHQPLILLAG
jgi:hypothetical protein